MCVGGQASALGKIFCGEREGWKGNRDRSSGITSPYGQVGR